MLNENDIVQILTEYLKKNSYKIIQSLTTDEKGVDIIADNLLNNQRLYVEVKGETSSKSYTNRFGKSFSGGQIRNHISRAVFASMVILSSKPAGDKTKVAIALPVTDGHKKEIETIAKALKTLHIKVFWVNEDGVTEDF